jgi:hypothetical protein
MWNCVVAVNHESWLFKLAAGFLPFRGTNRNRQLHTTGGIRMGGTAASPT